MNRVELGPNIPVVIITLRSGTMSKQAASALYSASTNPAGYEIIIVKTDEIELTRPPRVARQPIRAHLVNGGRRWHSVAAQTLNSLRPELPHTIFGNDPDSQISAVEIARMTSVPIWTEVTSVGVDTVTVSRRHSTMIETHSTSGPSILLFQATPVGPGDPLDLAQLRMLSDQGPDARSGYQSAQTLSSAGASGDLGEAEHIVCAGIGVGSVEEYGKMVQFSEIIGAAVGATRLVTDAGWAPHDRQIGTTGAGVSPSIYITFGVSGAIQHLAGVELPEKTISVNIDRGCQMMRSSRIAIVADAPAVLHQLLELLKGVQ